VKHLGDRITALVDDQLDHDARDLALAHLARCAACQAEVAAERRVAAALRTLPAVPPSAELVGKLLTLAEPGGPLPPERRPFPGAATPPAAGWRTPHRRAGTGVARRPPGNGALRRRAGVRLALAGSLSAAALTAVLASIGSSDLDRPVTPPTQQFTIEHTRSTSSLPFADPAAVVVPAGFPQDPNP
jgi:anti-sigma factor RsiW